MQKDAPIDQQLALKKRARRRLVGAIALVLLMIIVLPMVLKDRANTQPTDEVTITLSNSAKPTEVVPAISDFDSNISPAEDSASQVSPVAEESTNDTNELSAPSDEAPVAKAPIAPIKPEGQKADEKKMSGSTKYYVQIGVFSDEANVKQLQARLSDLGYQSQTEKIDTAKGKKIRLRTHLLGERNEAAIALQNIKDAGLTGMVVSQ